MPMTNESLAQAQASAYETFQYLLPLSKKLEQFIRELNSLNQSGMNSQDFWRGAQKILDGIHLFQETLKATQIAYSIPKQAHLESLFQELNSVIEDAYFMKEKDLKRDILQLFNNDMCQNLNEWQHQGIPVIQERITQNPAA